MLQHGFSFALYPYACLPPFASPDTCSSGGRGWRKTTRFGCIWGGGVVIGYGFRGLFDAHGSALKDLLGAMFPFSGADSAREADRGPEKELSLEQFLG